MRVRFFITLDMLTPRRQSPQEAESELRERVKRVRGVSLVRVVQGPVDEEFAGIEMPGVSAGADVTTDALARALFVSDRVLWERQVIPTFDALPEHQREVYRHRADDVVRALRDDLRSHPDTAALQARGFTVNDGRG